MKSGSGDSQRNDYHALPRPGARARGARGARGSHVAVPDGVSDGPATQARMLRAGQGVNVQRMVIAD